MATTTSFMTANEYAEITRSNVITVYNKCKSGEIPAIKRNGHWLIPTERVFDLNARYEHQIK